MKNLLPMERGSLQYGTMVRLSGALIQWCTELGESDVEAQKTLLSLDQEESIYCFTDEFITISHFKKFMKLGFSKKQYKKIEEIMKRWRQEEGETFLQLMDRNSLPQDLLYLFLEMTFNLSGF